MNICRNCGVAIAEFTFKSGKQWWHFSARPYVFCDETGEDKTKFATP